jgi:hypothetical protein
LIQYTQSLAQSIMVWNFSSLWRMASMAAFLSVMSSLMAT